MQLFSADATIFKKIINLFLPTKSCSEKLKSTFFPYCPELPKWPKQKNSCSKMWLYIELGLSKKKLTVMNSFLSYFLDDLCRSKKNFNFHDLHNTCNDFVGLALFRSIQKSAIQCQKKIKCIQNGQSKILHIGSSNCFFIRQQK